MNNKIPYIALLSNWYSGATLLTMYLNSHSQITSNGEAFPFSSKDNTRYLCSCGQDLNKCEYYSNAASHMKLPASNDWNRNVFTQIPQFSHNKYINYLLTTPKYESKIRYYLSQKISKYRYIRDNYLDEHNKFIANSLKYSGSLIYLDGTKSIPRANLFARDKRYLIKAIHLIRDGRGFCYSYMKNKKIGLNKHSAILCANYWLDYIHRVNSFSKLHDNIPTLTVFYEDMCNNPSVFFENILSFIQAPYEDLTKAKMNNLHILGNHVRKDFSGKIIQDIRWEQNLPTDVINVLTKKMGKQLTSLGYI